MQDQAKRLLTFKSGVPVFSSLALFDQKNESDHCDMRVLG